MSALEKQLLTKFKEKCPGARVLAFFVSGSHFFNLQGPSSDRDYRAVYMPSKEQLKSNSWKKQVSLGTNQTSERKNTKDDVDCTFYSLDEFLKLLANGDFNMLELLYAPKKRWWEFWKEEVKLLTSSEWEELVLRRTMFTPVNLSAFLGFVKGEFNRYGVDQSSFGKYQKFIEFLKTLPPMDRLEEHWGKLKEWNEQEKVGVLTTALANKGSKRLPAFKVASRLLLGTNKVSTLLEGCEEMVKKFGHRQKAQADAGVEYKGLYHALRLLYEAQDLINYGELKFPFDQKRHATLKKVKSGKLSKEEVFSLVTENLEIVQSFDETQRLDMEALAHKHDEFRCWVDNYFYNKKMQEILVS